MRKLITALAAIVLSVSLLGAGHAYARADTSPAWNTYYPQAPEGGLGVSLSLHYQIVGTGTYVDYFSRTVINNTDVAGVFYSAMCGPTFGCGWVEHYLGIGQEWNGTINVYGNMPVSSYTWWIMVPGFAATNHSWSVL